MRMVVGFGAEFGHGNPFYTDFQTSVVYVLNLVDCE